MLYTRSSFIKWLTEVMNCEIINLNDRRMKVITIQNGPAKAFIISNPSDRIDYEEIYIVCKKLWLTDMPGDRDLVKIE